ncbi:hypothetical protein BV401_30875 [Streptomyces malaysiensis subsp. malaysiensis]|uniref:Uncharacterized protein n=2 Tax=Streptomyces TaxID=1883 RepID=A0A2J7YXL0_STRMQ|nr:hypothetical protein BV401_30875 [Streptomyces autolyticus]PNG92760.1 hypothetical protein SMF913_28225 [Streptomyces malaysiensis]
MVHVPAFLRRSGPHEARGPPVYVTRLLPTAAVTVTASALLTVLGRPVVLRVLSDDGLESA